MFACMVLRSSMSVRYVYVHYNRRARNRRRLCVLGQRRAILRANFLRALRQLLKAKSPHPPVCSLFCTSVPVATFLATRIRPASTATELTHPAARPVRWGTESPNAAGFGSPPIANRYCRYRPPSELCRSCPRHGEFPYRWQCPRQEFHRIDWPLSFHGLQVPEKHRANGDIDGQRGEVAGRRRIAGQLRVPNWTICGSIGFSAKCP